MDIHVYIHPFCDRRLDDILETVKAIQEEYLRMADTLQNVLDDVTKESTVDDSIIALLNGLSAQLANAGVDPVKLKAIRDGIAANTAKITAAVTANTPAAPAA